MLRIQLRSHGQARFTFLPLVATSTEQLRMGGSLVELQWSLQVSRIVMKARFDTSLAAAAFGITITIDDSQYFSNDGIFLQAIHSWVWSLRLVIQ